MQKIVFTGGEGVGKSSLILFLETQGEYVIREAASDIIRLQRAMGISFPTDRKDFEETVLREHLRREKYIEKNYKINRVFIDRGWIDHIVYGQQLNWKITDLTLENAMRIKYHKVFFFLESNDFGNGLMNEKEIMRSRMLGDKILAMYRTNGYSPILVKPDTIIKRAEFILSNLK